MEGIRRHRERWLAGGGAWFEAAKRPTNWNRDAQLSLLPAFYLRVLPGLPGTGPNPVPFSAAGIGTHAEGFVVEFTLPTAEKGTWSHRKLEPLCGASAARSVRSCFSPSNER